MLTTKKLHNINRGRAKHSNDSGISAPESSGDFFISDLLRECREYKTPLKGEIISDICCCLFSSRNLNGFEGTTKQGTTDMNNLTFKGTALNPIIINNQPYLRVSQIGSALQYSSPDRLVKVYLNHADEFTPEMSFTTQIDTAGGKQMVRVFSLRGCHLLAMFSKTPVAKEFRKWVLDLIEAHNTAITNSQTADMKAIGGMVKSCCASAFRAEFEKISTDLVYKKILTDIIAKAFSDLRDDNAMQDVVSSIINNIVTGRVKNEYSKIITENNELKEKLEKIKSISSSNNCLRRVA